MTVANGDSGKLQLSDAVKALVDKDDDLAKDTFAFQDLKLQFTSWGQDIVDSVGEMYDRVHETQQGLQEARELSALKKANGPDGLVAGA